MIADDLLRLLERHDQRLALGPRRDIETVERKVVLVDADMHILETGEAGEPRLARNQPFDGNPQEGARAGHLRRLIRGA
ncbi:hypothetical protein D3C87_1809410 [compost metagenome]